MSTEGTVRDDSAIVDAERADFPQPLDPRPVCQPMAQTAESASSDADAQSTDHGWFYVSFAESEFLGGVIVRATDIVAACKEAHRLQINPGGQAIGGDIPASRLPHERYRNRLLGKSELNECWDDMIRLGDVHSALDDDKIPRVDQ